MNDQFAIRPVRPGDGSQLAERWIEFGHYYADRDPVRFQVPEARGLSEWIEKRIAETASLWLVAERTGRLVGFLEAQVWPGGEDPERQVMKETAEPGLHVNTLFVVEAERGNGIGRSLMEAAEAWGREMGATSSTVIAIADSPIAVPFYEDRMGYLRNSIGFWKALS